MTRCSHSRQSARSRSSRSLLHRPRPRLLPRLRDPGAAKDHQRPRRGDRPRRRDRAEERARQRRRHEHQRAARRRRRPARGPAREEGRPDRRRRPRRGPVRRRVRRRVQELPGEHDDQGAAHRRGLHARHAHARTARPRGADRRREPGGPRAEGRRARKPRRAAAVPRDPPDEARVPAPVSGHRHRRARAVRAAGRHRRTAQAAARTARPKDERSPSADARAIRVRARDQRGGRDRVAAEARPGGARHRGRAQPAADDEAPAREPGAPDRHQRPEGALLHPRAGRRDPDRGADPPRGAAEVRAARRAPAALSRRRERDRRPGRAQPRHDRRLALPGGRGRGPLGRLLGGEGEGRDPRRRAASGWSRWRTSTSGRT